MGRTPDISCECEFSGYAPGMGDALAFIFDSCMFGEVRAVRGLWFGWVGGQVGSEQTSVVGRRAGE